jgi:hypothetical protein
MIGAKNKNKAVHDRHLEQRENIVRAVDGLIADKLTQLRGIRRNLNGLHDGTIECSESDYDSVKSRLDAEWERLWSEIDAHETTLHCFTN